MVEVATGVRLDEKASNRVKLVTSTALAGPVVS
jgi:hypothetical protein